MSTCTCRTLPWSRGRLGLPPQGILHEADRLLSVRLSREDWEKRWQSSGRLAFLINALACFQIIW